MRRALPWLIAAIAASLACSAGILSAYYLPLASIGAAFSGLMTALSLLAGATLVRMARNAPITTPGTFNDEDRDRFFDTLESLASRLLWIFLQTMFAVFLVLIGTLLIAPAHPPLPYYDQICQAVSGLIVASVIWLMFRLLSMVRGDIGFVRLQRDIIGRAMAREKRKESNKVVSSPVSRVSPGKYGGIAGG